MLTNYMFFKKNNFIQIGFIFILFLILLFSNGCKDEITIAEQKGTLILNSNPDSASIYINDSLTTLITNDTIMLDKGWYSVHYKLSGYIEARNTVVIETDQTTILNENLININSLISISLTPLIENSSLFFSFNINKEITLESIELTHPTTDNGSYVVYSEAYNNILIDSTISYRFPQESINDFAVVSGTYTFLFKGKLANDPFIKEVIYQRN